jgi:hypothetical protein
LNIIAPILNEFSVRVASFASDFSRQSIRGLRTEALIGGQPFGVFIISLFECVSFDATGWSAS